MDSVARPNHLPSDQCVIPDLRGIPLAQLAMLADDSGKDVTVVVSRILGSRLKRSSVSAMMFNSTI